MRRLIIFLLLSIVIQAVRSQDFKYLAEIEKVDSSGFYYIFLPPEVTSKLNHKFSDIRIFDKKDNQIPYIRLTDEDLYKTARKIRLEIVQNDHKKQKKYTLVIVKNRNNLDLNNLNLIIDNKDGEIWVNISASNDMKNWHLLKNNTRYQAEFSDSAKTELRISDIPSTNYKYYRILIYDYNQNVFNVYKIFSYDIEKRKREFVEVEHPSFTQDDTSEIGHSIIKINFKEAQYVDKFKFFITEPKFYLRKAELIKQDTVSGQKIRLKFYDQSQKDFYLCSDSTNELLLSRYYVKTVFLIVENNDDKPLKFKDIRAYQQKEYLIAYLEKDKKYYVKYGNPNLPPPIYDLKFFRNKIPAHCPVVTVKNIKNLIEENKNVKSIYIRPLYLWLALGLVIIVLIFISFKIFKSNSE